MSFVEVESYLQISECAIIAAAALLAFDYCLTFGKEVEWLHGTKWTASRIHFVSLRYLPFVAIAMAIPASRVRPPSEADYCGSLGTATNAVYYLCIVLAEAMLVVRTYVFWNCNRRILIGMVSFGSMCVVVAIVVSETISSQSANPVFKSLNCPGSDSSLATGIEYLCLILYEIGMLGLNWIAFRRMTRRNPPGPLMTMLYRDGVMYVAAILAFSVLNAVVSLATPVQYSDVLNSPQMVMHSILASRIFFNLRETTRRERRNSVTIPLTEFHATAQGSTGFSSTLGTSSSSSRGVEFAETIQTTRVVGVTTRAAVVEV